MENNPPDREKSGHQDSFLFPALVHEIANPLNGILGAVAMIERRLQPETGCLDETARDLLLLVKNEIVRLGSFLNELKSLQDIFRLNLQPTSLAREVRNLLALQLAEYASRRIRVQQEIPVDLPPIMADRAKLRQVLLNLCKNAVEAMPGGGTLTVRGYANAGRICLEIEDNGNGVPQGVDVFRSFVTNKITGSGLGLAIVQEILQQHGATISYTSQLGEKTIFQLSFRCMWDNRST